MIYIWKINESTFRWQRLHDIYTYICMYMYIYIYTNRKQLAPCPRGNHLVGYCPLVNSHITMEITNWAMFNHYVTNYQRVTNT